MVRLGVEAAGEILTLQRAAYVTEAQAHAIEQWAVSRRSAPGTECPPVGQRASSSVRDSAAARVASVFVSAWATV